MRRREFISRAALGSFALAADGFVGFSDRFPDLLAGGRIGYSNFGTQKYPTPGATSSAFNVEIVPSLRYVFPRGDKPEEYFLQLVAGLYFTSISYTDLPGAKDKNSAHLGLSVGAGATYRILPNLYAVAVPLYNATTRNYLTLNVGLMYGHRGPVGGTGASSAYRRR
jgi:hypothetical protein